MYQNLCKLIETDRLPNDLYKIFKILTNFHFIELDELLNNKYIKTTKSDFGIKKLTLLKEYVLQNYLEK